MRRDLFDQTCSIIADIVTEIRPIVEQKKMRVVRLESLLTLFILRVSGAHVQSRSIERFVLREKRGETERTKRRFYHDQRVAIARCAPLRTTHSDDSTPWVGHFVVVNRFSNQLHNTRFEPTGDDPSV